MRRSNELHRVCERVKLESKQEMIGWRGRAFVSKYTGIGDLLTRTDSYRPIVVSSSNLRPGEYANVEIVAVKPGYFLGKLSADII